MIKKAVLKDICSLIKLNEDVQKNHHTAFPYIFKKYSKKVVESFFKKLLKDRKNKIFISCDDSNNAVGYIFYEIKKHSGSAFVKPYKVIYIHHLAVKPDSQKKGVGNQLIDHAVREAAQMHINRIELDVWSFNSNAKLFFQHTGFKVFNEKMAIDIN